MEQLQSEEHLYASSCRTGPTQCQPRLQQAATICYHPPTLSASTEHVFQNVHLTAGRKQAPNSEMCLRVTHIWCVLYLEHHTHTIIKWGLGTRLVRTWLYTLLVAH